MKKRYTTLRYVVAVLLFSCMVLRLTAQDIHYTNFGYSPLNINPALTGIFLGDMRFTGNYRSQWYNVPVSYMTFSGSYDLKFADGTRHKPYRFGAFFSYDQAGDSRLNNAALYIAGSYLIPLVKNVGISLGASLGGNQRRFLTNDLRFGDQYRNRQYDPSSPSIDPVNTIFDRTMTYWDANLGANLRIQKPRSRTALDVGTGIFHVNQPNKSFHDVPQVQLEPRISAYASGVIMVNNRFDILLEAMTQFQGPHQEALYGFGGRLFFVQKPTQLVALHGGFTIRGNDAVVPNIGITYNQWRVALNYDVNYSAFTPASNRVGGPELNVIYIFSKVPPAKFCPLCPTFL